MASNGVGRVYPRGGRTPQFLTFGLLVVICILAFNYWNVSSRSKLLQKQVQEMTGTLEELAMKKVHLEKRSEALQSQIADANHANSNLRQQKETCEKETELTKRENGDIAERLQVALNEKSNLLDTLEKEKLNVTQTIQVLSNQKALLEALRAEHENLKDTTLSEKDRIISELHEQQEILTQNLKKLEGENGQLESTAQGYKTQVERVTYQMQTCQNQLQALSQRQPVQQQQLNAQQQQALNAQQQQYQQQWQQPQQQQGGNQQTLQQLMAERYRQQQQQQQQQYNQQQAQQGNRLLYQPVQNQQVQQGLVGQQDSQNRLFQVQEQTGEESKHAPQENEEQKEEPKGDQDPGMAGMLVDEEQQNHQEINEAGETDGGHGGENGQDIDIGQHEQREYFEKQQELEEQMNQEENGMQIADPRGQDDEDPEGNHVGAEVHAPGEGVQYGEDIRHDNEELEGDERLNEVEDNQHIPLMPENNDVDGNNAKDIGPGQPDYDRDDAEEDVDAEEGDAEEDQENERQHYKK